MEAPFAGDYQSASHSGSGVGVGSSARVISMFSVPPDREILSVKSPHASKTPLAISSAVPIRRVNPLSSRAFRYDSAASADTHSYTIW